MPAMDTLKLFTSTIGDAGAALDIPEDGEIQSILMDLIVLGADALNDGIAAEISFASVSGFSANDTRASMLTLRAYQGFLTTGGSMTGKTAVVNGLAIPVSAGERIYLHTVATGTVTFNLIAYLYVMFVGGSRALRRRRSS